MRQELLVAQTPSSIPPLSAKSEDGEEGRKNVDVSSDRAGINLAVVDLLRSFEVQTRDESLVDNESVSSNSSFHNQLEQLASVDLATRNFGGLTERLLSTAGYELRLPVTNMRMAIRMLKIALVAERGHPQVVKSDFARVDRYLEVLDAECQREINLINELFKQ